MVDRVPVTDRAHQPRTAGAANLGLTFLDNVLFNVVPVDDDVPVRT